MLALEQACGPTEHLCLERANGASPLRDYVLSCKQLDSRHSGQSGLAFLPKSLQQTS